MQKKTTIIIKEANLGDFLHQMDTTPNLENMSAGDLEERLSKEFDINVIQKEMESLGEENLKDLFDKLHVLPDDELQDTLRTCPTIREVWYKHFVEWTYASVP
jgi:hypothetical protein